MIDAAAGFFFSARQGADHTTTTCLRRTLWREGHRPPTPRGAPHRITPSRVPRLHLPPPPTLTTVLTSPMTAHTTNTPSTTPPHAPTPPTPRLNRHTTFRPSYIPIDPPVATQAHQQHQGLQGAPHHHQQPPKLAPYASKHHPTAAAHCLRTTAPPGCAGSHLPPVPHHRSQLGTARTTRHAHATSTGPSGLRRLPSSTAPSPAPPTTSSAARTTSPLAPPPETRPQTHHAEPFTNPRHPQRPPTHTTASCPSRGHQAKPHHQTPQATTTTTPQNPHQPAHHTPQHQPPYRPSPTSYTTPRRYGSTSGGSENRRCYASTPSAPLCASGQPPWSRRSPWGRASETSSCTPSSTLPNMSAPRSPPLRAKARPPQGAESGCPPSTGGDTFSDSPCLGGWIPRAALATTSPTWLTPHPAPPAATPRSGKGRHWSTGWPP